MGSSFSSHKNSINFLFLKKGLSDHLNLKKKYFYICLILCILKPIQFFLQE